MRFEDVSLCYEGEKSTLNALKDVTFSVGPGESVCLIGPSGCGKSSALRLACALMSPTSGKVEVDGCEIEKPRPETALILQSFGLLPWKNVYRNTEMGLKLRGVPKSERAERVDFALESVGLSDFKRAYPDELSGGMQQRAAIARALVLDIDLLLMDEPLSALDSLLREQMQKMLLRLWTERGYAQLMVTHSIEEAVYLGQKIIIMSRRPGSIVSVVENSGMGDEDYRDSAAFHEKADEIRFILNEEARRYE